MKEARYTPAHAFSLPRVVALTSECMFAKYDGKLRIPEIISKRLTALALLMVCLVCTGCGSEDGPVDVVTKKDVVPSEAPVTSPYILDYNSGPNGTIEGVVKQMVKAGENGSMVAAIPDAGYHFLAWSDGWPAADRVDENVQANLVVTANFALNQYSLTYVAGEHGSIKGNGRQTVTHGGAGETVTAVPAVGYHFLAWSDGAASAGRTDKDLSSDLTVTASFAINQYTLTYTAGEQGSIKGNGRQTVTHGGAGETVTAVPAAGYHFLAWSDGVNTNPRTDIDVITDSQVTANFAVNTFTIGGALAGLIEGTELALINNADDPLTLTADGNFAFATQLLDGQPYEVKVVAQPAAPNQTCTLTGASGVVNDDDVTDVTVECHPNSYTIGGTVFGLPDDSRVVLQNNQADDLELGANGKFVFPVPLNDGSPYKVSILTKRLPPKWSCVQNNVSGVLSGSDVTNVDIACFPDAELHALSGLGMISLDWNSHEFPGASFNLCLAREEFAADRFDQCVSLKDGKLETNLNSPQKLTRLFYNVPYWMQIEVRHSSGHRTYSQVATATPVGGFNDTGIEWCADNVNNYRPQGSRAEKSEGCNAVALTAPHQDAQHGRDADFRARKITKAGRGFAGFDFTKICVNGEAAGEGNCPPNPTLGDSFNNWSCTLDNVSGLMWEVKTKTGPSSQEHTYTWFNPNGSANGGDKGAQKGGRCEGSDCDTHGFVEATNRRKLCGFSDWRLPTRKELLSIVHNGQAEPSVDSIAFPYTPPGFFWSASPYSDLVNSAWLVSFRYGESYPGEKNQPNRVRLVRQNQ